MPTLSEGPKVFYWNGVPVSQMEGHLRRAMEEALYSLKNKNWLLAERHEDACALLEKALYAEKSREVPVQKKEYGLLGVPKLQVPYWYMEYVADEVLRKSLDKEYAASSCVMPLGSNIISGKPYPSRWSEKAPKPSVEARRPYLPDHLL